ncbi:FkbM family methyltransferase [Halobaculum sp. EA56]|uniref:FkbM family methyltransferase n=1 Tax=Halobaculum sp. EA56 TaxID=3421648 RepID=UPI003EB7789B
MQIVRSAVKSLGLEPAVRPVYRAVRRSRYRLAGETCEVEVEGARAGFLIPTYNEWTDLNPVEERPVLARLVSDLRPDDVFYDIGANIGLYSCLVADAVSGPVFAFEPHPANADRLEENVELNGAEVTVFRCALADSTGSAELNVTLDEIGSAGHSLVSDPSEGLDRVTVETRRGDEFVTEQGLPRPTVLKIDVEGAESAVLDGLDSTLSDSRCRAVYCETHADRLASQGSSVTAVRDALASHGFAVSEHTVRQGKGETFLVGERSVSPSANG